MSSAFIEVMRRAVAQFDTQVELAEALQMSPQRISDALLGKGYTFNIINCLRLAQVANLPPSSVLRAAGKSEEAAWIERLYGAPTLTSAQRDLLDLWMQLTPEVRTDTLALLRRLARQQHR